MLHAAAEEIDRAVVILKERRVQLAGRDRPLRVDQFVGPFDFARAALQEARSGHAAFAGPVGAERQPIVALDVMQFRAPDGDVLAVLEQPRALELVAPDDHFHELPRLEVRRLVERNAVAFPVAVVPVPTR